MQSADGAPPANYEAEITYLARSPVFVLGCILITVGTVGGIFFDFSWLSFLDIAFAAVHITGLWILILGAFSRTPNESNILTALSMFKVSAVLSMILTGIVFAIAGITLLFATMQGVLFLFFLAIVGGIGYAIIRYYFLALLSVLNAIKHRVTTGNYTPLDGLGSFVLLSYIGIAISIFTSLASMAGELNPSQVNVQTHHAHAAIDQHVFFEPDFFPDFFLEHSEIYTATVVEPFAFSWSILFVIAGGVGLILCLHILKRLD